ncbi:hypothetical protein ACPPVQ_11565 [Diaminobutyricibacter sp. McL0618]|uniref:hypothetical protein n=1 Tax=Leifsonia sp. McL0618 TaxID=3415677 RepID=UPI003CFB3AB3
MTDRTVGWLPGVIAVLGFALMAAALAEGILTGVWFDEHALAIPDQVTIFPMLIVGLVGLLLLIIGCVVGAMDFRTGPHRRRVLPWLTAGSGGIVIVASIAEAVTLFGWLAANHLRIPGADVLVLLVGILGLALVVCGWSEGFGSVRSDRRQRKLA